MGDELPKVSVSSSSRQTAAGTSVASEHLFSKARNVITEKRNCLASSKAVVFCVENLWAGDFEVTDDDDD